MLQAVLCVHSILFLGGFLCIPPPVSDCLTGSTKQKITQKSITVQIAAMQVSITLQSLMETSHFVTSKELTHTCNHLRGTYFYPQLALFILVNNALVQTSAHYLHLFILSCSLWSSNCHTCFLFKAPPSSLFLQKIMQRGSRFNDVPGCFTKNGQNRERKKCLGAF